MVQHLIIELPPYCKDKRKFQTLSFKKGRDRIQLFSLVSSLGTGSPPGKGENKLGERDTESDECSDQGAGGTGELCF